MNCFRTGSSETIAAAAPFVHATAALRAVCRQDAIVDLVREVRDLGVRRPMLLAGRRSAATDGFQRARAALDAAADCRPAIVATDIPAHSSDTRVEALADEARRRDVDGFIAVGGGSVVDTAKAIALLLGEGGRLVDHASTYSPGQGVRSPPVPAPKRPIVSVPVTASGAEVTPSFGIRTGDGHKLLFRDPQLSARVVLLDPRFNLETPAAVMLATGMNGLAHCLEGLYASVRSPVSSALAVAGARRFMTALPAVAEDPDSIDARAALLAAGHLSGLVLVDARTCLHHALCHVIGATTGAGHGDANAVMLPHAIAFNATVAADCLAPVADIVDRLEALQRAIGVPRRLRDIGVAADRLPGIARQTLGERGLHYNPRPVADAGLLLALLEAAW